MSHVGQQMRNIAVLLFIVTIGIVAGFTVGVLWSTNQIGTATYFQATQALSTADKTIKKQNQQLQQAYQQLTILSEQLQTIQIASTLAPQKIYTPAASPIPKAKTQSSYSGEDLMQAVNKYRREHGVPELQLHSGLCQLASRRLGELINLGDLDNHAGFESYFNDHQITELAGPAITNAAENLASGYATAWEAVIGWDSSPPHRTFLLADGSYKYGCSAANMGFAVLIGGF